MEVIVPLDLSSRSSKPIPTNASKAAVHDFAERMAGKLGFGTGDQVDSIVARLGGKIRYHSLSSLDEAPESVIVRNLDDFTIFLPTTTTAHRDRFTICHELGHVFLHFPMFRKIHPGQVMVATRWVDETDPDQQRAEWEANWFAAAFLMPQAAFREEWRHARANAALVARRFGVSEQATKIRARTFGLS